MMPSTPAQTSHPSYPAVLDELQTAKWLGFNKRELKALIRAGHLIPLGKNRPRTQKRFAAAYILQLREDIGWLSTGRDIICAHWRKANGRKRNPHRIRGPRPNSTDFDASPEGHQNAPPNYE
jgi:hypothetical protein